MECYKPYIVCTTLVNFRFSMPCVLFFHFYASCYEKLRKKFVQKNQNLNNQPKCICNDRNSVETNTFCGFFFAGLHRSELTAGEIAEEMDKERKYLQLTTTEYLLKINEVRSKKGADLIEQLLEYYKAQHK